MNQARHLIPYEIRRFPRAGAIRVLNLEEAMAALESAGVEVIRPTFIKMGEVGVAVFAKDPDGLLIELVLAPPERAG